MFTKSYQPVLPIRDHRSQLVVVYSYTLLLSCFVTYCFYQFFPLFNAWIGYSPLQYIWYENNPENFQKDFMGEQLGYYKYSFVMWVYPFVYNLTGVDPELIQLVYIFVTTLVYAVSYLWLSKTLIPDAKWYTAIIIVSFILLTRILDCDFSRYGGLAILNEGKMHAAAVSVCICCLVFGLKGKWVYAGLTAGLLSWIYASYGVMCAFVIGCMVLVDLRQFKTKELWIGIISFISLFLVWEIGVLQIGQHNYEILDSKTWVDWVRFGNFHYFPFVIGEANRVFVLEHASKLCPTLTMLLLVISNLRVQKVLGRNYRKWVYGVVGCSFLTVLGLLASLLPFSVSLIQLALPRGVSFMMILCLPIAVDNLLSIITSKNVFLSLLALLVLVSPFVGSYGFPVVGVWIISMAFIFNDDHFLLARKWCGFILLISMIYVSWLVLAKSILVMNAGFVGPFSSYGVFCFILVFFFLYRQNKISSFKAVSLFLIFSFVVFVSGNILLRNNNYYKKSYYIDFKHAQKWANKNTHANSLFMNDPTHSYGWRDYSERSSYGCLREWIHNCIVYEQNAKLFKEGLRRVRLLGIDPEEYLQRSLRAGGKSVSTEYSELFRDVREKYYSLSDDHLQSLAVQEGIDFFIFEKKQLKHDVNLPVAYENDHYLIVSTQFASKVESSIANQ